MAFEEKEKQRSSWMDRLGRERQPAQKNLPKCMCLYLYVRMEVSEIIITINQKGGNQWEEDWRETEGEDCDVSRFFTCR